MKPIISVLALLLICGCTPKHSPESKRVLARFLSQDMKSYIQLLSPLDLNNVVTEFPVLCENWDKIENEYALPKKDIQAVHNALNFHKLFLLYHQFLSFDMDSLTPDERTARSKTYGAMRSELRTSINDKYWKKLSEKIHAPEYGENEIIALNELRTNEEWYMFARPQGLGGVVYVNMDELTKTLKKLTE